MQKRRRFKQVHSLEERLSEKARNLRDAAKMLAPCVEREYLLRQAQQAEEAAHLSGWLRSPGLQLPK